MFGLGGVKFLRTIPTDMSAGIQKEIKEMKK
jgi:hypothetical protein